MKLTSEVQAALLDAARHLESGRPAMEADTVRHAPCLHGFERHLTELGLRGFGWLRPDGVRARLETRAAERGRRPKA